MKYCAKNGLANNVRSYSLILSFLSFIDRGMRYRVAYSLLERYPKITLRCGRYYCFRCKLFSQERSLHPCVATSSSILQSAITTTSVSETDLPPVPGPPPQAIRDIFADILRSFSPPQCSPLPLKQCAFTCCLCLEEHEALSFFDGCSKPQCTSESNLKPVCKECMLSYVKNRIDSSPYSLSQIKCLNCSSRIPTAHWSAALKSDTNKIHNDRLSTVIQKCKCRALHPSYYL